MKKKTKQKYIPSKNSRENIRVKIEDLNEKGEGIAFHNKLKINVKKALPGEDVLVRYMPDRPRKDRIRLLEILSPSALRTQPPCQYFERCGGCQLQHVRYKKQLEFKQNWLKQLLLSYPQLKQTAVDQVMGMPQPASYRNKTQMPFQKQDEKIIYGLYQKGTHEVTPIDYCLVENKDANRALQIIREWAEHYRIEPYDETSHSGLLRHALIRKGQFTNQIMVVIVAREKESPYWHNLIQDLKTGLPTLKSVILNINPDRTNTILGNENLVAWGAPFIEELLGRIRFRIYPNTFFQTNSVQAVRMLEKMSEIVKFQKSDRVLDLFCGVGAIGLYVAGEVDQVVGIDINADSIAAATQNADDNEIWNARFITAGIEHKFANFLPADFAPNIIVVDPPRKGLTPRLIREIAAINPEKIVYISCNPKTLVEDLAAFYQLNYRTDKIYPFDMFPHTSQLENLVLLQKAA